MINDFQVRAFPNRNEMHISLDGYFMKSELELALQLVRSESKKLGPDFRVFLNIVNLKSEENGFRVNYRKLERFFRLLGSGDISLTGDRMTSAAVQANTVGFYAYENAWFL
ncbi:MAG: hypothetical protein JW801_07960 [Bacteroidales bacterium]|nr:hypothetical protein [Bacteroidales bacterium]